MKIICETKKDREILTKASEYLHDFTVWRKKKGVKQGVCLDQEIPLINTLMHLYTEPTEMEINIDFEFLEKD